MQGLTRLLELALEADSRMNVLSLLRLSRVYGSIKFDWFVFPRNKFYCINVLGAPVSRLKQLHDSIKKHSHLASLCLLQFSSRYRVFPGVWCLSDRDAWLLLASN